MVPHNNPQLPTLLEENILRAEGYRYIAGIDEVGRGALAGPLLAAAVILPEHLDSDWVTEVRDSKLLTASQRERLAEVIRKVAVAVSIGQADCVTVDRQGISQATRMAMKRAIEQLLPAPEIVLIDYFYLPDISLPQKGIVDGDSRCFSIACASIVAKVARDHLMTELDKTYTGYAFADHKGYGTSEHLACLSRLGPSPVHRLSFKPVKDVLEK